MVYEYQDYRDFLRATLVQRIQKNSGYSLRAFASNLGLSPSMLSEVLKGKKKLSVDKAILIAAQLNLEGEEEQYFVQLVQLESTQNPKVKHELLTRLNQSKSTQPVYNLTVDHYQTFADWISVAGITLLSVRPKGLNAQQIATKLGITPFEATEAMNRWVRLGLVEVSNNVYTKAGQGRIVMHSKAPNEALRKFHQTLLMRANDSLETQSPDERFIASETLAFDPKQLPQVAKIIEVALQKVVALAKTGKQRTEVYSLATQFFSLSKTKTERKRT